MKKHFITYGSNAFIQSAETLLSEVSGLRYFDQVKRFGPEDLPLYILSSPLFLGGKGGGHWLWKPYIIYQTLTSLRENDLLVYADAGCTVNDSEKWNEYFALAEDHNMLLFQYKSDHDYGWKKFNPEFSDSPKIKHWAKKSLTDHFSNYNLDEILKKNKILAGFLVIKNTPESRAVIYEWLATMLYFPHLVVGPLLHEVPTQTEDFAKHRHDQSVFSIIARIYEQHGTLKIIDEDFETENAGQALRAARRRVAAKTRNSSLLKRIINRLAINKPTDE